MIVFTCATIASGGPALGTSTLSVLVVEVGVYATTLGVGTAVARPLDPGEAVRAPDAVAGAGLPHAPTNMTSMPIVATTGDLIPISTWQFETRYETSAFPIQSRG